MSIDWGSEPHSPPSLAPPGLLSTYNVERTNGDAWALLSSLLSSILQVLPPPLSVGRFGTPHLPIQGRSPHPNCRARRTPLLPGTLGGKLSKHDSYQPSTPGIALTILSLSELPPHPVFTSHIAHWAGGSPQTWLPPDLRGRAGSHSTLHSTLF